MGSADPVRVPRSVAVDALDRVVVAVRVTVIDVVRLGEGAALKVGDFDRTSDPDEVGVGAVPVAVLAVVTVTVADAVDVLVGQGAAGAAKAPIAIQRRGHGAATGPPPEANTDCGCELRNGT